MTPTPLTRDGIIARNLAAVADHFANENSDGIARVIAGYTDDIVWEGPARGIVIRDKDQVRAAYLELFESWTSTRSPTSTGSPPKTGPSTTASSTSH